MSQTPTRSSLFVYFIDPILDGFACAFAFLVTCLVVAAAAIACLYLYAWMTYVPPTADELYGCTLAQSAPNGECK